MRIELRPETNAKNEVVEPEDNENFITDSSATDTFTSNYFDDHRDPSSKEKDSLVVTLIKEDSYPSHVVNGILDAGEKKQQISSKLPHLLGLE